MPSAAIRTFLDRLEPGEYFDCGPAGLPGIDEVLEDEAVRRGRTLGDDRFMLVGTDIGLIYCRPSISFAIAGRWPDITVGVPAPSSRPGRCELSVTWPTHGRLDFIVSRRLASNIHRRWSRGRDGGPSLGVVGQDVRFEQARRRGQHETSMASSYVSGRPRPGDDRSTSASSAAVRSAVTTAAVTTAERTALVDPTPMLASTTTAPSPASSGNGSKQNIWNDPDTFPLTGRSTPLATLAAAPSNGTALGVQRIDRARSSEHGELKAQGRRASAYPPGPLASTPSAEETMVVTTMDLEPPVVIEEPDESESIPVPQIAGARLSPTVPQPSPPGPMASSVPVSSVPVSSASSVPAPVRPPAPTHRLNRPPGRTTGQGRRRDWSDDGLRPIRESNGSSPSDPGSVRLSVVSNGGPGPLAEMLEGDLLEGQPAVAAAPPADPDRWSPRTDRVGPVGDGHDGEDRVPYLDHGPTGSVRSGADEADRPGPRSLAESATLLSMDRSNGSGVRPRRQTAQRIWYRYRGVATAVVLVALTGVLTISFLGTRDRSQVAMPDAADPDAVLADTGATGSMSPRPGTDDTLATLPRVTTTDGSAIAAPTIDPSTVTTQPTVSVAEQSVVTATLCHSNYSGCVPLDREVDCVGQGAGPSFLSETVTVLGPDVYQLDTDGDGTACEPDQPALEVDD